MSSTAPGAVDSPEPGCAALYVGTVMHARMKPVTHRFNYRVFTALINLDRLDELDRLSAVFSVNRFNLFSFYPSDHGPRKNGSLAAYVRDLLREGGLHDTISDVCLLCYPRLLGYAFNPLSVYYAYAADKKLLGIVYEVRNTFGEHHTYVAVIQSGELTPSGVRQKREKLFYVSPGLSLPVDTTRQKNRGPYSCDKCGRPGARCGIFRPSCDIFHGRIGLTILDDPDNDHQDNGRNPF